MSVKLSVCIPTYNRNEILLQSLRLLLPQLTPACRLLILDNCSPTPVAETLKELWPQYLGVNYEIRRNRVNVGGNANIMRCFEQCETDWLWVLGDDDPPKPDAIATIFRYVDVYPDTLFFSFLFGGEARRQPILTKGLEEFVYRMDSFSGILFLSASLYKVSAIQQNLKVGYTYTYSTAPHIATLLMSLGDTGACCLSGEDIVDQGPPRPSADQWSLIHNCLAIMTLLDLPLTPELRRELASQVLKTLPKFESLLTQLILMEVKHGDRQSALYFYDQIIGRSFYFASPLRKAQTFLYRLLLLFPRLSFRLIALVFRLSGRPPLNVQMLQDYLARM
jgi:glycosyltransferase involved in cell wall biosynthesis